MKREFVLAPEAELHFYQFAARPKNRLSLSA
jgi:hypothetical protein